jgi:hypothetical protein
VEERLRVRYDKFRKMGEERSSFVDADAPGMGPAQ